jgi:hypothetical protein
MNIIKGITFVMLISNVVLCIVSANVAGALGWTTATLILSLFLIAVKESK